jgi:hypothetical protein
MVIKNMNTEVILMAEMVLDSRTLPEPLFRMIRTEKVKVRELNGIINLTPILETKSGCPLRGMAADSSGSVPASV